MINLETLVEELHQVAATREAPAPLSPEALAVCTTMTTLPRYANGIAGQRRLYDDLESAVDEIFDEDDRRIARVHFRLDDGELQYLARHRKLDPDADENNTKTRRRARTQIEPRLAFHLFQRGIEWEEPDAYLDYGFRAISHDWSLTVDPDDRRRETYSQIVKARCVRPGQRFYVFGANDDGAEIESVRVISDDPDHILVGENGVVRLDRSVAARHDYLIVVYLGKDYTTNDVPTIGIERVIVKQEPLLGSGLYIAPVGEISHARLTVHASRQMVPRAALIEHDFSKPWTTETPDKYVERSSDDPIVFPIPEPEIGIKYEIAWDYSA